MTDLLLRAALFNAEFTSPQLQHLAGIFLIVMISAALVCFMVSEITFNYSQVDKLWSFMPIVYSLIALAAFPSPRLWLMFFLVAIWGFRLSYNFYRKGGYNIFPWKGEEDYRWKIMRGNPILKGRFRFGLFNFFFISFYQHSLILLFCTPLLMAARNTEARLNYLDIIAAFMMLLFIITESIADNQLFKFHKLKKQGASPDELYSESLRKGFLSEGLWHYVRHPNFVSEQLIWISFYLFGVAASGKWINFTLVGAILLVLLFQGSSALTEKISSEKYPDYADYKKKVPKFLPRLFKFVKN
jgi:steroid 5-alpha reductase family enzyme